MNTGVCGELKSRKHLMMASGIEVVSAGVAYVSLINDGAWVALVCSSPTDET